MLRKLLKYDFRANMKIFLFVWPAIIVFALIERLAISADLEGRVAVVLISTTTFIFVLAVIAACVFALIISIYRFYGGLLRDEGYLMFTLPVKPWQLIVSKFITAFVTVLVTIVLSILSMLFLFDGIDGFFEIARIILRRLDLPTGKLLAQVIAIILLSMCTSLLQIYISCSVGHLAKKHRILFSVLVYFGINIVLEIINITALVMGVSTSIHETLSVSGALWITIAEQLVLCAVYFFTSERLLRKHLNLE